MSRQTEMSSTYQTSRVNSTSHQCPLRPFTTPTVMTHHFGPGGQDSPIWFKAHAL